MRTLTAPQEAQRLLRGVKPIWLVVGALDEYGLSTETLRFGTNGLTLSGNAYADGLAALSVGMTQLQPQGGMSSVASFSTDIRDETAESDLSDTHVISNDEVIVYGLFYTGSDTETDLFELVRGVIERDTISGYEWRWSCKDGSLKDFRLMPSKTLDPATYYYAWAPGEPLPEAFGNLNVAPYDAGGDAPSLAPCRFTNRYALECTSSLLKKTGNELYQWYEQSGRFAEIVTTSETDNIVTMDDQSRVMSMRPSRPKSTNDVAGYQAAMDDDDTTGVVIANGDNLDLWLTGTPKLGTLTAIKVEVVATGSYTVTVKDDATTKLGPSAVSGDQTLTLTLGDYSENWDIALLNVEIDGTGAATINEIKLRLEFDDFLAFQDQEPRVFQSIVGFDDQTANYKDGAVIAGAGTALRNPVHQLAALLRATNMMQLPTAKVDSTYISDAASYRTDWAFDWWFTPGQQVREDFVDDFAFQAGLNIWKKDGKWRVVARDKDRTPQHFFLAEYHSPVKGNRLTSPLEPDFKLTPADASQIYNEIAIRYRKHPATEQYKRTSIASGQYRIDGTCALDGTLHTLTDGSATFQADDVIAQDGEAPGEYIYVAGDTVYEVVSVDSETVLTIEAVDGGAVSTIGSATAYYLGPYINGQAFVSQQAYKVVNALGGARQQSFLEEGGFRTDFVREADTAEVMKQYFLDWFASPRNTVEFPLFHVAAKLEEGDVFHYDNERLFPSLRGYDLSSLDEDIDTSETTWSIDPATVFLIRTGDYLYTQDSRSDAPECVLVVSVSASYAQIVVTRAQLGTEATTHADGSTLTRVTWKWLCTGLRPPAPSDPVWRVKAEQMPNDYFPVAIVSATGYPDWGSATPQQRVESGWATLRNGFVVDTDRNSNISYVGPDSGTYVIT